MDREDLIFVLKAQQWEKCKGELMAFVALACSQISTSSADSNWEELKNRIETFIQGVEDELFY